MSPSETALGALILVAVLGAMSVIGSLSRRRRQPDQEDLAVIPEDEIKPEPTDA